LQTKTKFLFWQFLFLIPAFSVLLDCQNCLKLSRCTRQPNDYLLHGNPAEEAEKTERLMQELNKILFFKLS
jgi:hypothetical protein